MTAIGLWRVIFSYHFYVGTIRKWVECYRWGSLVLGQRPAKELVSVSARGREGVKLRPCPEGCKTDLGVATGGVVRAELQEA